MSQPEGIQPEGEEVIENDDLTALEDNADVLIPDSDEDDADSDESDSEEENDFDEWEAVPFPQEKLDALFNLPQFAKRKGGFKALTGMFSYLWDEFNSKMAAAHQVVQADRKAQHDFQNADEYSDVRIALAEKREEIAADEKPFDSELEKLTKAYNERVEDISKRRQSAVGDRIAEADKLEAETVAGIKSALLTDLGATDNVIGEMQDFAKQIRDTEKHPSWVVKQKKTRRNGDVYTKEVPVFSFPIPNWTKTLGKDGLSSTVAGAGKRVVRIDFMSVDGTEITDPMKRNFTYLRNKLGISGSVTETTTARLLEAVEQAGLKELPTDRKFEYVQNDKDGNAHQIVVQGRPTDS